MAEDSKYGKVSTEHGNLPENEPLFILRARDPFAGYVIRMYAQLRRSAGDVAGAAHCEGRARLMEAWPEKRLPD